MKKMRMSKAAMFAAILGALSPNSMPQQSAQEIPKAVNTSSVRKSIFNRKKNNRGNGKSGNSSLPKEIQAKIIKVAYEKRIRKSKSLKNNAYMRDLFYYMVKAESNKNRFYPLDRNKV